MTDAAMLHQLHKVLRAQVGMQMILLDGLGMEYTVEITSLTRQQITAQVVEERRNQGEPAISITLYQALPKKRELFEEILQHGTEVGITRFVPILTARTAGKGLHNVPRLERILQEAAEQSERGVVPSLGEVLPYEKALAEAAGFKILADSYISDPLLADILPQIRGFAQVSIFVGPEGGFTEAEVAMAQSLGVVNFSLGPRILRTETAGVVIAGVIGMGG